MNRNEYQRQWRHQNNLLQKFLSINTVSAPENVENEQNEEGEMEEMLVDDDNAKTASSSDNASLLSDDDIISLHFSSDNEGENQVSNDPNLVDDIARWMLKNRITRTASNELLAILRVHGHYNIPKCTRTILATPRNVTTFEKCGGSYVYLGLANGIKRTFIENPQSLLLNMNLDLVVNVDGVPLYKSTGAQLWPILCMFNKLPPFIVGIFYGKKKPSSVEDFMSDFFEEYLNIKNDGLLINNKMISLKITAFVCDTPARSFLKCVKGHTGFYSCERCEVKGESVSHRTVFHDLDSVPRNDERFQEYHYARTHQIAKTPLIDYEIKCVNDFPLDYMHLVCLGVVKRLIKYWTEGPRAYRLSATQLTLISTKLHEYGGLFPDEFARQPRGIDEFKRWKATEFRQFLLYSGVVVLKDIFSRKYYEHFVSLSLALRILLEEDTGFRSTHLDYAKGLLRYFVGKSHELYGSTFTVYNVHSLSHLWQDSVYYNKPLDDISSFPFENYLQVLKKFVRKTQNPLAQVVKRITEFENYAMGGSSHKVIQTKFSTDDKDSWFLHENGDIIQAKERFPNNVFACHIYRRNYFQNVFTSPCESLLFDIIYLPNQNFNQQRFHNIHKSSLLRKVVRLPYRNGFVVTPLLHDVTK